MDGLPESHISSLLGDFKEKTEVAPVVWATVRRQIKPLVRMITVWHTGEPRIQYFHSTIQQVFTILFFHSTIQRVITFQYLQNTI